MPANNSKTNRNIRRASVLSRFKVDPQKMANKSYVERKAIEEASLRKTM